MNKVEIFLKETKLIEKNYTELNRLEVHSFNIFSILLKSGDEVHLHTKFIYELLNPHGTHYQGSLFLDLFLEELKINISSQNLLVFREKQNIDILLKSAHYAVIIENKIHTKDHSSQLGRYYKTIKSQGYNEENITIIYLTLFGDQPLEKEVANVEAISYRYRIVSWLERCIFTVKHIPILHNSLIQYLSLVKKLTNQSTQKGIIMDVKDLLLKDNNLKMIIDMESSVIEAKIEVQFDFWQTLLSKLIPHYPFSFYNSNNNKGLRSSIRRYYSQQKNIKDYGIEYEVDENLYFFVELRENIYYGFYFIDEDMVEEEQRKAVESLGN